jgi:RNA polymerase sigma factor (sigma-70 family)
VNDELFNELAPWAIKAADHWCCKRGIDSRLRGDCVQEALIECWKATARFDPAKGSAKAFCMSRMIGAVRDFLRKEAPLGYRNRKKKNFKELHVWQNRSREVVMCDGSSWSSTTFRSFDVEDPSSLNEQRHVDTLDQINRIAEMFHDQNLIVWILLARGMLQQDIAKEMKLSESRVSQLVQDVKKSVKERAAER